MLEPATAKLVAQGIEAARNGNRLLARLHFERAAKSNLVDPIVWLWMAWGAESPEQAALHLKKLQTGPYAAMAAAGLQWLTGLDATQDVVASKVENGTLAPAIVPIQSGETEEKSNGPVYSLCCPGCRGRLRIWGKLIGPLHRCPACATVFVAEQDPNDPARIVRRRLSAEPLGPTVLESVLSEDAEQPLVLVVDDRPTRRQLMLNVLRRAGFRVESATTKVEVDDLVNRLHPQLILLDGNMHNLDARTICKQLRGRPETQATPILILSNKTGFFDQVQAKLAGCTSYLTKPCEADAVVARVRTLTTPVEQAVPDTEVLEFDMVTDARPMPSLIKDPNELQESIFG